MGSCKPSQCVYLGILYGAGPNLGSKKKSNLEKLNKSVYTHAHNLLKDQLSAPLSHGEFLVKLVYEVTQLLENSEFTNCGFGSELNLNGEVECDASMMLCVDKRRAFASIGAVKNLKTPSSLCEKMLSIQAFNALAHPRAVPNFIVGDGALSLATMLGLYDKNGNPQTLVSERARTLYDKYTSPSFNDTDATANSHMYTDTVGVIAILDGNICISSSSGGSFLKDPGRLGPAAILGSGFDINYEGTSAVVCSGFGEDMNTQRLATRAVNEEDLNAVVSGDSHYYMQREPQYGVLKANIRENGVLFEWENSARSMMCSVGKLDSEAIKSKCIYNTNPMGGGYKFNY